MRRSAPITPDDRARAPDHVSIDQGATPFGAVVVAATERGVCWVGSPGEPIESLIGWLEKHLPAVGVEQAPGRLASVTHALNEYLETGADLPDIALDLIGTPFQVAVWRAVRAVPYGETRSYAEIARAIGHPLAPRAVGAANAVCPVPFFIPCHRVIGADGAIKGYSGGRLTRAVLLDLEARRPRGA